MIKKICDSLAGWQMTLVSGVFLLLDLIPHLTGGTGSAEFLNLPFDPAWVSVIISGVPLVYLAVWRLIHNPGISKISSALLIVIAMFAAIGIGDLFAAGEVAFIMAIGAILEEKTTERARKGLKKLLELAPEEARRIVGGYEEMISVSDIQPGDLIRVLPGETIPADGTIVSGETSVDQSVMTGESLPVDKTVKDTVSSGTICQFGSIDFEATRVGEDSSIQTLIRMVQEAENKKAPMARIADKAASWLVPVALGIAIVTCLVTHDIVRAVTVLVVFCPCALVLATPTAIMAAIGQATKHGVIIKSGEALETMGKVDVIAFDKTGTLTHGTLEVSDIFALKNGLDKVQLLSMAASAEKKSEHPLARAIVAEATKQNVPLSDPVGFKMTAGRGIQADVQDRTLWCGNESWLEESGITPDATAKRMLETLRNEGKASIIVADKTGCLGIIAMSDMLRTEAPDIIRSLHDMDTQVVLLTGDNARTASHFAKQAGIDQIRADLLPQQKTAAIEQLQKEGHKVCMVGDGVNDAPALKLADTGVAMGSMGSDIAVEAADIALMSDDVSRLPYLKRLANATVKTIKFSIGLSMCINFVAVTLSVMGVLNPTTGALVHNAGSVLLVLIAALLYDRKFD